MKRRILRSLGIVLIGSVFYSFGVVSSSAISLPDQGTIDAEGGGTYVPNSLVTLASNSDPSTMTKWELDRYETTTWDCIDLHWKDLATNLEIGSFGGCGIDPTLDMPVMEGELTDDAHIQHWGAFGYRTPVGTATMRVTLTDNSVLDSVPLAGVWVVTWTGSAEVDHVDALSPTGGLLQRCQGFCSDE